MRRISTQRDTFARHIEASNIQASSEFPWRVHPEDEGHGAYYQAPLENGHSLEAHGFPAEEGPKAKAWGAYYIDHEHPSFHPVPNPAMHPGRGIGIPGQHFWPSREHAMQAAEQAYKQKYPIGTNTGPHDSGVDYSDLNSFKDHLSWYKHAISQEDFENYRNERHRQEVELEGQTGGYSADKADYFARGGKPLINLKDYMKGLKVGPGEQAARQAPVSHEVYTPDPNDWGGEPAW